MKNLIILSAFMFSVSSYAEVINCTFTEPFISFSYNTATETLVEKEAVMDQTKVLKKVSFQIKYAGTFLLKDKAGKLLAELKLNNQGSDGMSDAVYPYDAKYMSTMGTSHPLFGGCTSSLKPMVREPN